MKKDFAAITANFKPVADTKRYGETFKAGVKYDTSNNYFFDMATCRDRKEYNEYFGPAREDE